MTQSLVWRLAMKDLHVHRGLMLAAAIGGIVSLLAASVNRVGFSIGSICFITTVIAYGVVLAMFSVAQERKDKSVMFVLSLPIAPRDYVRAKLLGTLITFLIPWALLTAGAFVLIAASPGIKDGLMPTALLMQVYFLCAFCVVMAVALIASSEVVMTFSIIITNMSFTLFMVGIGQIPSFANAGERATANWSPAFFAVLAGELALIAIALSVPSFYYSRRRDFI